MSGFGLAPPKPEVRAVPHPWEGYVPLKRKQELLRARLRAHQLEIVGLTRASAKHFAKVLEEDEAAALLGGNCEIT